MSKRSSEWIPIAIVFAFFMLIGVLEALSLNYLRLRAGRPTTLMDILSGTLPSWLLQVSLIWPVRAVSRRVRIGPATWPWAIPVHALTGSLFVVVTVLGSVLIFKWFGQLGDRSVAALFPSYLIQFMANQFAIYGVMVGIFHALDYLREAEQRERERALLAVSLTEARLNALRSQLSPHFFFNTLNAISTFALQGRPERVAEMVGALGDLVRASLDERLPHEVPLGRELELLDLYLDIQRVRFEDWLIVEREVAPEALDVLVPSLMLQPLIENAIEHGGQDASGTNRVRIRCMLEGGRLAIEVRNAPAADPAAAATVRRRGVGLRNTAERLEQLHPGRHELRFGPEAGGGFLTELRIPVRREPPAVPGPGAA